MGCGTSSSANPPDKLPDDTAKADENKLSAAPMIPETRSAPLEPPLFTAHEPQVDMDEGERGRILKEICVAARTGNVEELGRLFSTDKGRACIVDKGRTESGWTPLHWAVRTSRFEAMKLLVDGGAEVDAVKIGWGTPLTLAAQKGYESIAEYLLRQRASKEMAIQNVRDIDKALVEGFFIELERVIQHRIEFQAMREELKAMVRRSEKPETLPTTCKGITIEGLKKMKALIQSECEAGRFKEDRSFPDGTHCKGTMQYDELTTTDIVYRFVKDESVTDNLRLVDKPGIVAPEHKALPTFFISHAWKGRFSALLDQIFAYAENNGLTEETTVWIDVFSVNQHGSRGCSEWSQSQNQEDVSAFKDVVQICVDGTLVVCDFEMCKTYSRAWCLYEWDWTMFYHGREKLQILGLTKDGAKEAYANINVDQAMCFKDKDMILNEIVDKHGSTEVFNIKLKKKWIDVEHHLKNKK